MADAVLDGDAGAGEDHRRFDALAIHELDARRRLGRIRVVDVLVVVGRQLAADLLAQAPGSDACERSGSTDEAERLPIEGDDTVAVAVVVHAERALQELGCDVPLEEIERLVVVVVGVDDPIVDGSSGGSSGRGHLPMV